MALHRTPEEHDANPPESWVVVKAGNRIWHLRQANEHPGDGPLDSYPTRRAARQARHSGPARDLYEKEGRWFAGLPVLGWRPYDPAIHKPSV